MPFPSPPWQLRGQLWLSLFAVGSSGTTDRPPGLYGAAFVDYQEGGVLAYRELLVARLARDGMLPRVTITDIWVDSEASRDGGRSLWAIPKELADLDVGDRRYGPAAGTRCAAHKGSRPIAGATFTGLPGPSPRTPYAFTTRQERADGSTVRARVRGTARSLPCLGGWHFAKDGPLAWLRGHPPLISIRASDFRLTFGA
ncbi:MAG TPA: acetoacetate decarboxylase family protein [Nocardioidaceae bacterium]|nr:acetoacetate decarboxylase family protein [Nocardioidaceae bacterium]